MQGLLSQVGQSHDPGKRAITKRGPLKTVLTIYIGADLLLLESQTSFIGFEFPAKPSIRPK